MLNRELTEQWIAALRSGRYLQGRGVLHKAFGPDRFCCLGVACDLHDSTQWQPIDDTQQVYLYDGLIGFPSPGVVESFGMDDDLIDELVGMNDDAGLTFPEIADYLQAKLDHQERSTDDNQETDHQEIDHDA